MRDDIVFEIVKAFGALVMLCVIIIICTIELKTSLKKQEIIDDIRSGIISDKTTKNQSGLFYKSELEYRIYIKSKYDYEGETLECEKYFSVPLDVYKEYSIGDEFDITELKEEDVNVG